MPDKIIEKKHLGRPLEILLARGSVFGYGTKSVKLDRPVSRLRGIDVSVANNAPFRDRSFAVIDKNSDIFLNHFVTRYVQLRTRANSIFHKLLIYTSYYKIRNAFESRRRCPFLSKISADNEPPLSTQTYGFFAVGLLSSCKVITPLSPFCPNFSGQKPTPNQTKP